MTYGQIWWPILRIHVLQLTHPKCTHTAVNIHTHREQTPGAVGRHLCCGTRGTVGATCLAQGHFSRGIQGGESAKKTKMAPLCWEAVQVALLRLCFYLLFYSLLLFLFTHISSLITYDIGTLLDIGQRYTNLFQDTLSSNPLWPLEILRNAEENNGHLNNPLE